jgi:CBS domain-containing membrane protein
MKISPPRAPRSAVARFGTRLFVPILAGATLRERVIACVGALVGIAATATIGAVAVGLAPTLPLVMAPAGASAVLLFAVPASPLAQPWSIIGGNTISALVGVAVASLVDDPALAAGLACALAIAAMSLARCLHPPGGAVALTAVVGGPAVTGAGFAFALAPVALNSVALVLIGLAFHRLVGRAYPHRPPPVAASPHGTLDPPPPVRVGFRAEDVDAALASVGETLDVDRGDLERVLREVERHALVRTYAGLTCADLMSRDVVSIGPMATLAEARALILERGVRCLPVIGDDDRLAGVVGLRDLVADAASVAEVMVAAATATPGAAAVSLAGALTDGRTHAVMITDTASRLLGLVTQTDLLAALARSSPNPAR